MPSRRCDIAASKKSSTVRISPTGLRFVLREHGAAHSGRLIAAGSLEREYQTHEPRRILQIWHVNFRGPLVAEFPLANIADDSDDGEPGFARFGAPGHF